MSVGDGTGGHVLDLTRLRGGGAADRERHHATTVQEEHPANRAAEHELSTPIVEHRVPVHRFRERHSAKRGAEDAGQHVDRRLPALPFAKRVFLAYPLAGKHGAKFRVVGRPIPERACAIPQAEAREIFELPAERPVLLVATALAGARSINELVVESFAEVGPAILHISGERDFEPLRRRVTRPDYRLIAATDRIGAAYSAADLVLSRAGSGVWELAAAGKPAILVPYPFATADHQAKNADFFVRAGGAVMVRELDLEDVPEIVRSMLDDPDRLARMGDAMRRVAKPHAAAEIAEGLIELASP